MNFPVLLMIIYCVFNFARIFNCLIAVFNSFQLVTVAPMAIFFSLLDLINVLIIPAVMVLFILIKCRKLPSGYRSMRIPFLIALIANVLPIVLNFNGYLAQFANFDIISPYSLCLISELLFTLCLILLTIFIFQNGEKIGILVFFRLLVIAALLFSLVCGLTFCVLGGLAYLAPLSYALVFLSLYYFPEAILNSETADITARKIGVSVTVIVCLLVLISIVSASTESSSYQDGYYDRKGVRHDTAYERDKWNETYNWMDENW